MHGRVKTRSTEEEAARKQKERAKKVVAYQVTSSKIFQMREQGELNGVLMNLIAQVLSSNPDIYTFWNIRREVLLYLVAQNEMNDVDICETQTLYEAELPLTENCLRVNPKSYSAWHHRCWVLDHMPNVNWTKELAICTKYLKLDERNFHCWDYRRYVVSRSETTPLEEFQFSTKKIHDNFSNYSAWHYRSKLLPLLYNDETQQSSSSISDSKLQEELEIVQNAAFTDPNDSSAWFYQRWLLGKSEQPLDIISATMNENMICIALSKQANCGPNGDSSIRVSGLEIMCDWTPFVCNKTVLKTLWCGQFRQKIQYHNEVVVELLDMNKDVVSSIILQNNGERCVGYKKVQFGALFGERVKSELMSQLESCTSLIELEPDSKWTLLTSAIIMRALNHRRYHRQSLEILEKLQKVDAIRKGYYVDLRNRWIIENAIEGWLENFESWDDSKSVLNLRDLGLTQIYHKQYFLIASRVDLRGNNLSPRLTNELKMVFNVQVDSPQDNESYSGTMSRF